jgi:hypothetical protein
MTKISELQAKKAVRNANPKRQYGYGAITEFKVSAGKMVDLMAVYVEQRMPLPPNSGKGCRVQPKHIENCFNEIENAIRRLFLPSNLEKEEEE